MGVVMSWASSSNMLALVQMAGMSLIIRLRTTSGLSTLALNTAATWATVRATATSSAAFFGRVGLRSLPVSLALAGSLVGVLNLEMFRIDCRMSGMLDSVRQVRIDRIHVHLGGPGTVVDVSYLSLAVISCLALAILQRMLHSVGASYMGWTCFLGYLDILLKQSYFYS